MFQKLILVRHAQVAGQCAVDDLTAAGHLAAQALALVLIDFGTTLFIPARNCGRPIPRDPFATRIQGDLLTIEDLRERVLSPVPTVRLAGTAAAFLRKSGPCLAGW